MVRSLTRRPTSPARTVHHDTFIAAMMRQCDLLEGRDDHTGRTCHQLKAALMVRAVGGSVETRRQLSRRVPDEGDVPRIQNASLAQLQV